MPPARMVNVQHAAILKQSEKIRAESRTAVRRSQAAVDHAGKVVGRSIDVRVCLEDFEPRNADQAQFAVVPDRRQAAQPRRAVPRNGRRTDDDVATERVRAALVAEVATLQSRNALLENAALTFGALAERLNERPNSGIKRD